MAHGLFRIWDMRFGWGFFFWGVFSSRKSATRVLKVENSIWLQPGRQGSCSLVQLKSWKDEMHTVTKFRIWGYCWLTTKVCRRLFQVDSIIVRTFCHSSVYNFSCGTQKHINILCCFSPLFGGGRKKSFDRGGFWLSRKCVLNLHSQDQREHTSCSECCILCLFGW